MVNFNWNRHLALLLRKILCCLHGDLNVVLALRMTYSYSYNSNTATILHLPSYIVCSLKNGGWKNEGLTIKDELVLSCFTGLLSEGRTDGGIDIGDWCS